MSLLWGFVRRLTSAQWELRAAVVAGIVLALVAPGLDGDVPRGLLLGIGVVLALGAAITPDRDVVTVACCWVLVVWVVTDRGTVGAGALVAAVGLVVAHVAATLAAYGPERMTPDRRLVLLWVRRTVIVLVPSALVALVTSVLSVRTGSAGSWLWVAGALLVAGLAAAVSVLHRAGS